MGHLEEARGTRLSFADDLSATAAAANERLARLIRRIEDTIAELQLAGSLPPAEPVRAFEPGPAPRFIDLDAEDVRTIVWATGFRRSYPWLKVPVLKSMPAWVPMSRVDSWLKAGL